MHEKEVNLEFNKRRCNASISLFTLTIGLQRTKVVSVGFKEDGFSAIWKSFTYIQEETASHCLQCTALRSQVMDSLH